MRAQVGILDLNTPRVPHPRHVHKLPAPMVNEGDLDAVVLGFYKSSWGSHCNLAMGRKFGLPFQVATPEMSS